MPCTSRGLQVSGLVAGLMMKGAAKKERPASKVSNGMAQPPFQECQVEALDELVTELEKSKPAGSLVEVTRIEEMHHTSCMQEMSTVVVHGDETGLLQRPDELVAVYQYCAACKSAVRIL